MNTTSKATTCQNLLGELTIEAGQTVSKPLYQDDQVRIVLFGFAAGQELSEHTASIPAILHFLSGEAHVTLGDQSIEASAGTLAHMPAHLPHSILAKTETCMLLTMLKEPKR